MTLWDHSALPIQWGVVLLASLIGAVSDVRTGRIPNKLTVPLFAGGVVWATCIGGLAGLVDGVTGSLLLAMPYVVLFLLGGGAGDAKLMGGIGVWLGVVNGAVALVSVIASGLVLAVAFALARRRLQAALGNVACMVSFMVTFVITRGRMKESPSYLVSSEDMQTIPYGVGIFVGVCVAAGGVLAWHNC